MFVHLFKDFPIKNTTLETNPYEIILGDYGPVYAVSQTAVCLAYGLGPLLGGALAERVGFPLVMTLLGLTNVAITPLLLTLKQEVPKRTCRQCYPN